MLCVTAALLAATGCTKKSTAQSPVDLHLKVSVPFRFVAYGDTRFHDPKDTEAANPPVRVALVQAIAEAHPAFVCFTGDIVYNGNDVNDWKTWDTETSIWRDKNIPIYPALGNHDLHGDEKVALANYFQRFPDLKNSRYYYERHEHGGVTYFVSGGGAAHAYPIERAPDDPFQSKEVNYHYLLVEVDHQQLKVTMNRIDLSSGKAVWTQPDSVKLALPSAASAKAAGR